jgi:hypothetical protein
MTIAHRFASSTGTSSVTSSRTDLGAKPHIPPEHIITVRGLHWVSPLTVDTSP